MTPEGMTERFEMRMSQSVLEKLDTWRAVQEDVPTRSEAVRRLVEIGLGQTQENRRIEISDGNKLIIAMLCQLFKQLKLKGEFEPDFLEEVIYSGHFWGLAWKYSGLFDADHDEPGVVQEVADILNMWRTLEGGFDGLSKKDKERVVNETVQLGKNVRFPGFDGNGEGRYLGVADFIINHLDRFAEFKGRDLNAHMQTLDLHRRMLAAFEPIQRKLMGRNLDASELTEILSQGTHPTTRRVSGPRG